jgi:4-amino-4-deoxy-L-arabinose transferase-like glycosyltransferase
MTDIGMVPGTLLFIVLAFFGCMGLALTWNHRLTVRFQMALFLVAFGVRFAFSICVYQFGLVKVLHDEDSSGWVMGVPLQQLWSHQRLSLLDLPYTMLGAFQGEHFGYKYLLGALFYVVNSPTRMIAAVLNCFFGALTVVFAYRIARILFSEWVAVRVGWWTCLLPSLIVWSGQTVKEPAVIFLETLALYGCVNLRRRGFSLRHGALCAAATLLVIPFRFYVAYITAGAIVTSLLLPHIAKRRMSIGSALMVVVLLVPLFLVSGVLIRHESQFDRFDAKFISTYRRGLAAGAGSGVETSYDIRTNQGLAAATVTGGAYLLFAPFPWELGGSPRKMLTTPELFVWWWLVVVALIPGLWYTVRKRFSDVQPLLFFVVGLGLLYSVTFGNVGLAYRQRAQLLPWLIIFAMAGFERRVLKRRSKQLRIATIAASIKNRFPLALNRRLAIPTQTAIPSPSERRPLCP